MKTYSRPRIQHVPTHVITGFLGVGKTTAIQNLLAQKPEAEQWAVLVNEFGQIGVDGSLYPSASVIVREVNGGCMCCTSALPMQVALNQLLRSYPDRVFIEPTGLGHPVEVLAVLKDYGDILDLQKTITLVDARQLRDSQYRNHPTFKQQMDIADLIVANKQDQYQPEDIQQLESYLQVHQMETPMLMTQYGQLDLTDIGYPEKNHLQGTVITSVDSQLHQTDDDQAPMINGFTSACHHAEGFYSYGWRFADQFNYHSLKDHLSVLSNQIERLKAVMHTNQGVFSYNLVDGRYEEKPYTQLLAESRIEIITMKPCEFERGLLACRMNELEIKPDTQ